MAVSPANATKLVEVFQQFGFGDLDIGPEDFQTPDYVIEIGREPRKIQVLTGIDGIAFHEAYASRVEIEYQGISLKFIGKSELIKNKRPSGRPKDLLDAEQLEQF